MAVRERGMRRKRKRELVQRNRERREEGRIGLKGE